jgi:hypothetical protein
VLVENGAISKIWKSESHGKKVAALRLFYPSISSVLFGNGSHYRYTVFQWRRTVDLFFEQ